MNNLIYRSIVQDMEFEALQHLLMDDEFVMFIDEL